ncbi:sugar phosphate nucleotidyltransferase [Streptomyces lasalocidi]
MTDACREQGVRRFYVVTHGLENRNQIKLLLGHGERYGVDITYSRSRFDRYNVGSAGATLHNLEQWDLQGRALVLPVDSLFDFDLAAMETTHRAESAVVTVASVARTAAEIAGKYGVMRTDERGLVQGFVEKPGAGELRSLFPGRSTIPPRPWRPTPGCTWWTAAACGCSPASRSSSGSPTSAWTGVATSCPTSSNEVCRSPPTRSGGWATWATCPTTSRRSSSCSTARTNR